MRSTPVIALSILTGIALGAALVEALHAQGKPQAYVVGEISVTDPEGFAKEFSPLARKALGEAPGYRALVLGGKTVAIEGPAPKTRVVINVFDNLDAAVQAYNSADFKSREENRRQICDFPYLCCRRPIAG